MRCCGSGLFGGGRGARGVALETLAFARRSLNLCGARDVGKRGAAGQRGVHGATGQIVHALVVDSARMRVLLLWRMYRMPNANTTHSAKAAARYASISVRTAGKSTLHAYPSNDPACWHNATMATVPTYGRRVK